MLGVITSMDSILPLIRDAEFLVAFACDVVILILAFCAYKRTKKIAFVLFVISSVISIVGGIALYRYGSARASMSPEERENFQAVLRIVAMTATIITTAATVLLIRYVSPTTKSDT